MDIQDTRKLVRRISEDAEMLRKVIESEVEIGRMLVNEEIYHEFRDEMLIGGNHLATAEVMWREFARLTPRSKKFGIVNNHA